MNRNLKLTPCIPVRAQYPRAVNHCGFVSVLEDKYLVSLTDISIFGSFAPAHRHFGSYDSINVEEEQGGELPPEVPHTEMGFWPLVPQKKPRHTLKKSCQKCWQDLPRYGHGQLLPRVPYVSVISLKNGSKAQR